MSNLIQNFMNAARKGSKLILAAAVLFANLFFTRAQATDARVFYHFDNAAIDVNYLSNPETFATIDSFLAGGYEGELEIIAYSSPEGNFAYNTDLSRRRAESLRRWLLSKYPSMDGRVSINPDTESWDALRSDVVADSRISESSRNAMLKVIDSSASPDAKEAELKAMKDWGYFYSNYFRTLRYATLRFNGYKNETSNTDNVSNSNIENADSKGSLPAGAAQDNAIIFDLNKSYINRNIFDNTRVLAAISNLLGGQDPADVEGITIVSTGSPEGPESLNKRLSAERGAALRDYIVSQFPALEGKIKVIPAGEAWDDFRVAVESDPNLSEASRKNILSILVSNSSNDAKEQKLRSLPEWNHILNDVFPGLRYAKMQLDVNSQAEPAEVIEVPVISDEDAINVEDEEVTVSDSTLVLTDTTLVVPTVPVVPAPVAEADTLAETKTAPATIDITKPIFAASTNVVYDLGGLIRHLSWTPNFAIEVPIGQKWSVYGEYSFPWWVTKGNDQAWEILKWDIGARRWLSRHNSNDPMDVLSGHFIGIDLGAGYYDIEPKHTGYQGEFQTVGLEYGYAFKLGRAWRLDLFGGLGWMGTHYRYYEGDSTDQHLLYQHHGKMNWFGPVKAGVSIKYIFHKTERREER